MAAVTFGVSTWATTGGTATGTATPALSDLIVIFAGSTGLAGGPTAASDNNSGGAGTYVQVDVDQTTGANTATLTAWVRTALIASATSTIFTTTQVGSSGGGLAVYRVSAMTNTGATAVRSSGGQSTGTTGTTPAPVLSLTPLTTNPILIGLLNGTNGSANQTVRAGYTEGNDQGFTTPAAGFATQFINSGESSATLTFGGTTPSAFATIALELDATAATPSLGGGLERRALQQSYVGMAF